MAYLEKYGWFEINIFKDVFPPKNNGCRNLKSLLSIDNFPHSRGEGYRGLPPHQGGEGEAGADFQIFSFMVPATMPRVWGAAGKSAK